jgi:hypothetical protein
MPNKRCFKCGETKPLDEFPLHPAMADGHLGKCKVCNRLDARTHRQKNIDRVMAYEKVRNRQPRRIQQRKEYLKSYRTKYPESNRAHQLVALALRRGDLVRQPCQVCGVTTMVNAHHDDYSKPLDVIWFCGKHHREYHVKLERKDAKQIADEFPSLGESGTGGGVPEEPPV